MARKKQDTSWTFKEVKELYRKYLEHGAGKTSKWAGISRARLHQILVRHALPRRPMGAQERRWTIEDLKEASSMLSISAACKKLKTDTETLKRHLNKAGLPIPKLVTARMTPDERKRRSRERWKEKGYGRKASALAKERREAGLCFLCGKAKKSELSRCARCLRVYRRWMKKRGSKSTTREMRLKTKETIFAHYGPCECCGERGIWFLTLDHIKENGADHRRKLFGKGNCAGYRFYLWVIKKGFPSYLRSMCFNCNTASFWNGGTCPHQSEKA